LFDITISDTDYLCYAPETVLSRAEVEKKHKYFAASLARRAHFTPLCFSVYRLSGSEASCFIKWLATGLSLRWEKNYPEVLFWIRATLTFALVQVTGLCIRETRTKWSGI